VTVFGITILLWVASSTRNGQLKAKELGDQIWTKQFFFLWVVSSIGRGQLEVMQMGDQIWTNFFFSYKQCHQLEPWGDYK